MHYRTRDEQQRAWADAAAAKLRADSIDSADIIAVRNCLCGCVGGVRLFQFWQEVHGPLPPLFVPEPEQAALWTT